MKRMMADAESRLRAKLTSLPDGSWSATGYQDQSHEGDRNLHKITVTTTKTGDHLTFDFTGTDPQAGVINCTYAGMRGGVMLALLPILAGDIPWSAGGLMRCFDLVTEEGTINNATFPAAVSRGPDRARVAHRQPGRRVPLADARPRPGARQERPGHLLRHLGHGGHRGPRRARRAARPVPVDHHGADGGRVRRPPARRRHRHRRAVLHPDGPRARRRDDRVPLPGAHPVAARGARLRRAGPAPRRAGRLDRDHPARHERADGAGAGVGGQGRRPERRPLRRLPRQQRPRRRRAAEPGRRTARGGPHARRAGRGQRRARTAARTTRPATWPPARCSR